MYLCTYIYVSIFKCMYIRTYMYVYIFYIYLYTYIYMRMYVLFYSIETVLLKLNNLNLFVSVFVPIPSTASCIAQKLQQVEQFEINENVLSSFVHVQRKAPNCIISKNSNRRRYVPLGTDTPLKSTIFQLRWKILLRKVVSFRSSSLAD